MNFKSKIKNTFEIITGKKKGDTSPLSKKREKREKEKKLENISILFLGNS
jgi:hypothetical protein